MKSGELTKRITIQYPTHVSDGMGGDTETWNDHATVWAKAWSVSSSEDNGTLQRIQKFKIRYRRNISADWRVKWGDRYFNIVSIDPDEKAEALFLICRESE